MLEGKINRVCPICNAKFKTAHPRRIYDKLTCKRKAIAKQLREYKDRVKSRQQNERYAPSTV